MDESGERVEKETLEWQREKRNEKCLHSSEIKKVEKGDNWLYYLFKCKEVK